MYANVIRFSTGSVLMLLVLTGCNHSNSTESANLYMRKCVPIERSINSTLAENIDTVVEDAVERGFAGGIAVIKNGTFVYNRTAGSASLTENVPVTDETLFHVASIAKYFTAALVLKSIEEGMIAVDDPIAKYAPDMKLATRGVTIADLLSHRSGLGSSYVTEQETDRDDALAAIDNVPYDPDKLGKFNYSNDGYDVLGVLLERIYGRDYEDLLREKILTPACLERPRIWSSIDLSDPEIISQPLAPVPPKLINRNYGMIASGGLLITAEDLAAYQWALSRGNVLSVQSIETLFKAREKRKTNYATFGGFWREHDVLGARLSARGYEEWGDNAILIHYLDKDIIVAVVTSRGPAEDSGQPSFRRQLSNAIENLLAEGLAKDT